MHEKSQAPRSCGYNRGMSGKELVWALAGLVLVACSGDAPKSDDDDGAAGQSGANASAGTHAGGNGSSGNGGASSASAGASGGGAPSAGSGSGGATSGGSAGASGSGGKGGAGGAAGKGGGGAGGLPACVVMDDESAPFISYEYTEDAAPAAMGGDIAAGTYFLTKLTYHGGTPIKRPCLLSQVREVLRFSATSATTGTLHETTVFQYEDGSGTSRHPSETVYEVAENSLKQRLICSSGEQWAQAFSATSDQFRFIRGPFSSTCDEGVTLVLTYQRQP
jgi:hypothetical protein